MLQSLGQDEASAAVADGEAHVRCEFCGQGYTFSAGDIDRLFERPEGHAPAPERLQ